jgi:tRNA pseudouridine55 synthase
MSQIKTKATRLPINGILLVNKPQGLTSNAVLQRVKHLFNAKKAGHTGSLDPLATGMLPICFGEATKFCQYLLDADKCYQVVGRLGSKTNTGDSTGIVTTNAIIVNTTQADLEAALATFVGETQQIPTMFSALKHNGTPLYRLARAGIEVERSARTIQIHNIELNSFDGQDFALTVTCSKGTYIRNLVEDLGDKLGVGAHVTVLHRCFTLGFAENKMYTLDELNEQSAEQRMTCLIPMELAVTHLPSYAVNEVEAQELYHGRSVNINNQSLRGCVRLHAPQFIGLGDISAEGVLTVRRLLSREIEK